MKVPEVPSRPRDAATEGLIKDLLEEEEQAKANKRAAKEMQGRAPKKGKTLAEIEKDEGGVVRESMVAMAHTKRATARRGIKDAGGLGDVEVDVDIEAFEEDLEEDMDAEAAAEAADEERRRRAAAAGAADDNGGVKFEPFNLKYEREHGYFDEDGNYVEKASKEEEEERDAWLDGEAAKPVSEEVLRRLQEREKAEAAVRVAPLTGRELAAIKAQIAGMLQPRETVAKALKRLGTAPGAQHRAMGKREKQKLLVAQQQAAAAAAAAAGKGSGSGGPAAAAAESDLPPAAQIALLTELAHRLLNEGETDVYSDVREDFLHAAELYMPPAAAAAAATGATFTAAATGGGGGGGGDMFADDGDDDMFGADDNSLDKAAAAKQPPPQQPASGDSAVAAAEAAAAAPGAAPPPAAAAAAAATEPSTSAPSAAAAAAADDFASWPIKELKRYLTENGVDVSGMVEKGEMVARAREAAARGPLVNGGGAAPSPANAASVPPGYDFHDPSTGYYWSSAAGMYFDPSTSGYYQPSMQKWFVFKDGTFVEWSG